MAREFVRGAPAVRGYVEAPQRTPLHTMTHLLRLGIVSALALLAGCVVAATSKAANPTLSDRWLAGYNRRMGR